MRTYRFTAILVMIVLVLSACNMPTNQPAEPTTNPLAVYTAAAETVVAKLTQNALLVPTDLPTATVAPSPTNTPVPAIINTAPAPTAGAGASATSAPAAAPTSSCDNAQFINDVTIPDGTIFTASATFVKTWRLKNTGTCTWNSSYALVFDTGDSMAGPTTQSLVGDVAPGATVDISVNLQAPAADGTYRGYWGLKNPSGQRLTIVGGSSNRSFYVEIKVGTGGGTTGGKFAVTSVGFTIVSQSGSCASMTYNITATVVTNNTGDVTYTWVRSDGVTGTSGGLSFDKAGSQTTSSFTGIFTNITSGTQWVELYIDKPNHQQFGRLKLNCP
jgi:hypothetical protein